MKKKKTWGFKMAGEKSAEVYIYEDIGEYFGGLSSKQFAEELSELGPIESIKVRINSMGGQVFDGFAIYNLLNQHPAKISVVIDGIAASIASVIAMAGDTIEIAENGFVMIHEPWSVSVGHANAHFAEGESLIKLRDQGAKIYSNRGKITEAQALEIMKGPDGDGVWLTSEESLESGFVDSIIEPTKAAALVVDRKRFPNAPAALVEVKTLGEAAKAMSQAEAEAKAKEIAMRSRAVEIDSHVLAENA